MAVIRLFTSQNWKSFLFKLKFNNNKRKNQVSLLVLLIAIGFMASFQNCSQVSFSSMPPSESTASVSNPIPVVNLDLSLSSASPTNLNTISVKFLIDNKSNALISTKCQIDEAEPLNCASPYNVVLVEGSHSIKVIVLDKNKTELTRKSENLVVDLTPPSISVNSSPDGGTSNASTSISFNITDTLSGVGKLECILDGTSQNLCQSPLTLSGLTGGAHKFLLKATDKAGNMSSKTLNWNVNLQAPVISITNPPHAWVNSASQTINFSISGSPVASTFCKLDNTNPVSCSGTFLATGLVDGPHSLSIDALGTNGIHGQNLVAWSVDTISPVLVAPIDPPPSISTAAINSAAPLAFSATDAGSASGTGSGVSRLECQFDSANWSACVSPISISDFGVGVHNIKIRATDFAGNISNIITKSFEVIDFCGQFQVKSNLNSPGSAFDGVDMLFLGYQDPDAVNKAMLYNVSNNTWRDAATPPANLFYPKIVSIASGKFFVVGNGPSPYISSSLGAAIYDKNANSWTTVTGDLRGSLTSFNLVKADSRILLWGGNSPYSLSSVSPGWSFDLSSNQWKKISTTGAPNSMRNDFSSHWTGQKLLIWGGHDNLRDSSGVSYFPYALFYNDGGLYDPVTDTWELFNTPASISPRAFHASVWTGTEMLIWGGLTSSSNCNVAGQNNSCIDQGAAFNPNTKTWRTIAASGSLGLFQSSAVFKDGAMYIVDGFSKMESNSIQTSTNALRYNVSDDSWQIKSMRAQACSSMDAGVTLPAVYSILNNKFLKYGIVNTGGNWRAYTFEF